MILYINKIKTLLVTAEPDIAHINERGPFFNVRICGQKWRKAEKEIELKKVVTKLSLQLLFYQSDWEVERERERDTKPNYDLIIGFLQNLEIKVKRLCVLFCKEWSEWKKVCFYRPKRWFNLNGLRLYFSIKNWT